MTITRASRGCSRAYNARALKPELDATVVSYARKRYEQQVDLAGGASGRSSKSKERRKKVRARESQEPPSGCGFLQCTTSWPDGRAACTDKRALNGREVNGTLSVHICCGYDCGR
jgi:hypothetical protein